MGLYKTHFLSLVRFAKQLASDAAAELGIDTPAFANLDAHENMNGLPMTDFIGLSNFAIRDNQHIIELTVEFCISTTSDPDLLRHTDLVDFVMDKLRPGNSIPIYTATGDVVDKTSWMGIQEGVTADVVERDVLRSAQFITVQLLSGLSGSK